VGGGSEGGWAEGGVQVTLTAPHLRVVLCAPLPSGRPDDDSLEDDVNEEEQEEAWERGPASPVVSAGAPRVASVALDITAHSSGMGANAAAATPVLCLSLPPAVGWCRLTISNHCRKRCSFRA